jgi:CHAT domain-containing protein/Tfp pilus assembly protein PilF
MPKLKRQSITRRSFYFLFLLLCFPLPSISAQSADEAAVRQLVEKFLSAYQKRETDALTSLWSAEPPTGEIGREELQRALAEAAKFEVKSYSLNKIAVEADQARAEIVFEVTGRDPEVKANAPAGKINRTLRIVRRNAEWKIWRYAISEEELASELAKVATDGERQALLAEKRAFVTVELLKPLMQEGNRLLDSGKSAQALDIYNLALGLAEQLGEKGLTATALRLIGNVDLFRGNYTPALGYYQKSLRLAEEVGDKRDIIFVSVNMGHAHASQGNYAPALEHYQKALRSAEELNNRELIAGALNSIGAVYKNQGAYQQALDYHLRGLKIAEEIRHPLLTGLLLNNIGLIYHSQNNSVRALEYYGRSLKLAEELGNKRSLVMSLLNIGGVHSSQGNYSQALEYYGKSLKLAEEIGSKDSIARLLGNIGLVNAKQGNYAQAADYHQRVLKLAEEMGSKELLAGSLNNIGEVNALQKRYEQALPYYERSLKLAEETGRVDFTAQALANMGETYLMLNRPQMALEYSGRAAALALEVGLPGLLWPARMTEGKAHRLLNRPDLAKQSFLDTISTIEKLRGQVAGGEQAQQRFFEGKVFPYHAMVELLVAEKDFAQAFHYAERAKGRVLLDVLSSGRVEVTKAMTSLELSQDRALTAEITALNAQILQYRLRRNSGETGLAALTSRLEKARLSYETFQANLYTSHPELKLHRGEARTLTLEEADGLLTDDRTALLEYTVTDEKTYLFVITRGAAGSSSRGKPSVVLRVYTFDIKSKELSDLAEEFRLRVAERNLAIKQTAQQLYDLLVRPVEQQLQGVTKLCIIPDGPLWNLPFQALHQGKSGYLLERYAIFYAPSLSVLREMMSGRNERPRTAVERAAPQTATRVQAATPAQRPLPRLLALGNPALSNQTATRTQLLRSDEVLGPLPDAEREVLTLGRLYGSAQSKILVAEQALEQTAKSEAVKYSVLHFATHAILDDRNPMYSRIVLSSAGGDGQEDGLLEAWEILKLDLHAEMVILSACQTAQGRIGAGEGMIGMGWALFVAGCPTVIVSQWKVDSARTADLMIEFHQNLLKKGTPGDSPMTKAEALRQSALKLLRSRYNHPAYWAGFVLVGREQ